MRVVIIGNGVAGIEAALVIKNREPTWDVTVVSEESDNFFSRTALMWVFCGQLSHRDIEPFERDLYANVGLKRCRARAVGVDVDRKRVALAGDLDPLPYDRLLIACGSRARPGPWKGSSLRGVGHFVTMQDMEWLEHEVHGGPATGRPPRPDAHLEATTDDSPYRIRKRAMRKRGRTCRAPAVIGGGLIGFEAVEILHAAGLTPHFFVREEWCWPMAIEPRESEWITDRMREHGVKVYLEHEVQEILGGDDRTVRGIRTDQGEHECDLAVVAIGVVPNTEWLAESDIERDARGGIVVDSGLCTSADEVYAAGDCASVRWFDGSQRPEQLWYTARDQGRIAGRALLGDRVRYDRGLWYNSAKLMDVEYTTAGLVNMQLSGERNFFYEEMGRVRSTTRITLVGDRVVGFNLFGRRWDHEVLLEWIDQRRSLDWVLDHLHEASFDTELVPPLVIPPEARTQRVGGPSPNPQLRGTQPCPF